MNGGLTGERDQRTCNAVSAAIIAAGVVYAALVVVVLPLGWLLAIPSDDAFYYFKIARNIVSGQGCTFDGIASTNGFHPLWMLCILPVFSALTTGVELPARVVLAGNGLLAAVTMVMLFRLVRRWVGGGTEWIALAFCALPPVSGALLNGLETGLLLWAGTLLLWLCYRFELHAVGASPGRTFLFGVLLGFITLCRLDSAFLLVAAGLVTLLLTLVGAVTIRRCVVRGLLLGLGFAVLFGPFCIWNIATFGHVMPISGGMKSSFPALRDTLSLTGDRLFGALLLAVVWGVVLAGTRPGSVRRWLESPLVLLAVACTLHFVHAFLFLTWGVYWWHFSLYGLTAAVGLAQAVQRWTLDRGRIEPAAVGIIIVGLVVPGVGLKVFELRSKAEQHAAWLEGARWARAETTPDTVFAIKDAGLFSYFSQRVTVNLDGKANGYAFRDALYADDVGGYLRGADVEYIAHVATRYADGVCRIPIPRVNRRPAILMMRQDDEVFRSRAFAIHRHRFRK
ncbi:MAG: hypothetical protein PVI86_08700, partial [Phycisphaerae bacterium]